MEKAFLTIGVIGNALQAIAYWPQISHLYKEKNSTGVSLPAWFTWLVGDAMLLTYSVYIGDPIFIALTTIYTFFTTWGIILIIRFKPKRGHRPAPKS